MSEYFNPNPVASASTINVETLRQMAEYLAFPTNGTTVARTYDPNSDVPTIADLPPLTSESVSIPETEEQVDEYEELRHLQLVNKASPVRQLHSLEKDLAINKQNAQNEASVIASYAGKVRYALDNIKYYSEKFNEIQKELNKLKGVATIENDYTKDVIQVSGNAINALTLAIAGYKLVSENSLGEIVYPFKLAQNAKNVLNASIAYDEDRRRSTVVYFRYVRNTVVNYGPLMRLVVPLKVNYILRISSENVTLEIDYKSYEDIIPHPHVNSRVCWGDLDHLQRTLSNLNPWASQYNVMTDRMERKSVLGDIFDTYTDFGASVSVIMSTFNASSPYYTYADSLIVLANTVNRHFRDDEQWYEKAKTAIQIGHSGTRAELIRLDGGVSSMALLQRSGDNYKSIKQAIKYWEENDVSSITRDMGDFISDSDIVDKYDTDELFYQQDATYCSCNCSYSDEDDENYEGEHDEVCASNEIRDSGEFTFNKYGYDQTLLGLKRYLTYLDYLNQTKTIYCSNRAPINYNEVQDENTLF